MRKLGRGGLEVGPNAFRVAKIASRAREDSLEAAWTALIYV